MNNIILEKILTLEYLKTPGNPKQLKYYCNNFLVEITEDIHMGCVIVKITYLHTNTACEYELGSDITIKDFKSYSFEELLIKKLTFF